MLIALLWFYRFRLGRNAPAVQKHDFTLHVCVHWRFQVGLLVPSAYYQRGLLPPRLEGAVALAVQMNFFQRRQKNSVFPCSKVIGLNHVWHFAFDSVL
jgi:hypothetical protein